MDLLRLERGDGRRQQRAPFLRISIKHRYANVGFTWLERILFARSIERHCARGTLWTTDRRQEHMPFRFIPRPVPTKAAAPLEAAPPLDWYTRCVYYTIAYWDMRLGIPHAWVQQHAVPLYGRSATNARFEAAVRQLADEGFIVDARPDPQRPSLLSITDKPFPAYHTAPEETWVVWLRQVLRRRLRGRLPWAASR